MEDSQVIPEKQYALSMQSQLMPLLVSLGMSNVLKLQDKST